MLKGSRASLRERQSNSTSSSEDVTLPPKGAGIVPKKIFIVDDADFIVDMLSMIMRSAGHKVVGTAFDGVQALESLKNLPPDLAPDVVTVDFYMPKLDGMETIRKIRLLAPSAKILLISAHATRPLALEAKKIGVDAFIVKPFEPQTVLDTIDKLA
jgi:two-component system chemotaxis response regulator CheY